MARRCEICGCEPCATPTFCAGCRADEATRIAPTGVSYEDFYAYAPENKFIFVPSGDRWPAATVNTRLPWIGKIKPSTWLHQNRPVEQMTWAPGEEQLVKNKLMREGGWVEHDGASVYNLYLPPTLEPGEAGKAAPWLEHVRNIYPDDAEHLIQWFAHRVQHPDIKINHALLLGGSEGIGKDTMLAPVRLALGHWNCNNISPAQFMGRFNGFLQSVLLVISEARDTGEVSRYAFYDHLKDIIAAPPPVLLVDRKHTNPYYIPNLVGVVLTTNYKTGGIHLNPEDRRHYVAWSHKEKTDFTEAYWNRLWGFYENGGYRHVTACLMSADLAAFNPKAPPRLTPAHQEIVNASRAPETHDFSDAIEHLGNPDTITSDDMTSLANGLDAELIAWMKETKNRRSFPRHFEAAGYIHVANPEAPADGRWRINGRKAVVYARATLPRQAQFEAIRKRQ